MEKVKNHSKVHPVSVNLTKDQKMKKKHQERLYRLKTRYRIHGQIKSMKSYYFQGRKSLYPST